jgi:hypothetical protein
VFPAAGVVVPRFIAQGDPTMAKGNFNSRTKRLRELAKKDKRAAKDEKRAQKKADARAARTMGVGAMRPTPPGTPGADDAISPGQPSGTGAGEDRV